MSQVFQPTEPSTDFVAHFEAFHRQFGLRPNLLTIPLDLLPAVKSQVMGLNPYCGIEMPIAVCGCDLCFVPVGVYPGMFFSYSTDLAK